MSSYSNRLQPPKPITICCLVLSPEIVMPDAYNCGRLCRTKVTHKASDAAEWVVQFFHPRSSCTTTHISADVQRITLNASCMMISGERTEQLEIFCRVTGVTSDFLSLLDVELIRFFHRAIQLFFPQWEWKYNGYVQHGWCLSHAVFSLSMNDHIILHGTIRYTVCPQNTPMHFTNLSTSLLNFVGKMVKIDGFINNWISGTE